MENSVKFESLLDRAGSVFQTATGFSAAFSDPVVIKDGQRNRIVRCRVQCAQSNVSSLIIKQIKGEPVRGFSDWASVDFLSGLPEANEIVPHFYGGDRLNRLFVMEDLGERNDLQDFLASTDSATTLAALRALATQMGRLHAATLGKEYLFEAIRFALPETKQLGRQSEAGNWLDHRGKLSDWFQALGCEPPRDFDRSLKHVADFYREADGFLAFTHGDPAPSNNHFSKGKTRLLDFEYGGFRHALYDITAWNILCPLPFDWVNEMSRCFREELAKTCPAARDEAQFEKGWSYLCAYRAVAMLTWIPPDIIHQNRSWAENWTMREAVFVALSRLKNLAASHAQLAVVHDAAGLLIKSLLRHWPEFEDAEALLPRWSVVGHHPLVH